MDQIKKVTFGIVYLILKISFIIAGIALIKMPLVNFIIDWPIYQIVGAIILLFLIYLELYSYFVKSDEKTIDATPKKKSALDKFKLKYETQ